jgi:hypothetical protein
MVPSTGWRPKMWVAVKSARPGGQLRPVVQFELGEHVPDVRLDGPLGEHQLLRDGPVRPALRDQQRDLPFPGGQRAGAAAQTAPGQGTAAVGQFQHLVEVAGGLEHFVPGVDRGDQRLGAAGAFGHRHRRAADRLGAVVVAVLQQERVLGQDLGVRRVVLAGEQGQRPFAEHDQRRGDNASAMPADPLGAGQVAVPGLADQVVREAQAGRAPRVVDQHARVDGLGQQPVHRGRTGRGGVQHRHVDLGAQRGGATEQLAAVHAELGGTPRPARPGRSARWRRPPMPWPPPPRRPPSCRSRPRRPGTPRNRPRPRRRRAADPG